MYRLDGLVAEVWLLASDYLVLLGLHSMGYRGPYRDLRRTTGWAGDVVKCHGQMTVAQPDPRHRARRAGARRGGPGRMLRRDPRLKSRHAGRARPHPALPGLGGLAWPPPPPGTGPTTAPPARLAASNTVPPARPGRSPTAEAARRRPPGASPYRVAILRDDSPTVGACRVRKPTCRRPGATGETGCSPAARAWPAAPAGQRAWGHHRVPGVRICRGRRSPDARGTCRFTAATTASVVPMTRTCRRARVTAV